MIDLNKLSTEAYTNSKEKRNKWREPLVEVEE